MHIDELLKRAVEKGASDLHIKVPMPPILRVDGVLLPQEDLPPMTPQEIDSIFEHITGEEQKASFNKRHELDFSYSVPGLARFRVNVMQQRGTKSVAFRFIPYEVPTIDGLGLPQVLKEISLKSQGFILITGPTGAGKSTTMAAMINHLNENVRRNVITIEDPIEFLHRDKKSIIRQRDLGDDTFSFSDALIHALRHDVDVIVLGEMRDLDTIGTAMTAAETGHLVMGTLHTNNVSQTIDRIIDMFPFEQQKQVRLQFSQVVAAVISQILVPLVDGGQTAAFEILVANKVTRGFIRDEKALELPGFLDFNTEVGMQSMNKALADLVKKGKIPLEEAEQRTYDRAGLAKQFGKDST